MKEKNILLINEKISILFRIITDIIERNNLKQITKIELSENQFMILKILNVTGPKNGKEIADILNISSSAASKNINFLVQKGLISRKMITFDRRTVKVMLRDKGRSLVKKYYKISEAKMESIINNLDAKERQMLNLSLDNFIYACLNQEPDLSVFCLQCGGKYEGRCPVAKYSTGCYFKINETNNMPTPI
jgi:DNA-binding MarR family transcriptional regulator